MLTVTTPPAAGGPAMPLSDFILIVFCLVDDLVRQLAPRPLRRRGFAPALGRRRVPPRRWCRRVPGPGPHTRASPPPPPPLRRRVPRPAESPPHHLRPPGRQPLRPEAPAARPPRAPPGG